MPEDAQPEEKFSRWSKEVGREISRLSECIRRLDELGLCIAHNKARYALEEAVINALNVASAWGEARANDEENAKWNGKT